MTSTTPAIALDDTIAHHTTDTGTFTTRLSTNLQGRTGILGNARVADLKPGDITRGIRDSRIITGPPVRIEWVRDLGAGKTRVRYHIIGWGTSGTRTLDSRRSVTVER